jgi:hypothetical protein
MHNDAMTITQQPLFDSSAKVRVTVPVTVETLELFKRLAAVQGSSVGKAMGEWLGDTGEAVESMTKLLADARRSPVKAARQLSAYASGLVDLTDGLLADFAVKAPEGKVRAADRASFSSREAGARTGPKKPLTPPVSNTGGKVSEARKPKGSK